VSLAIWDHTLLLATRHKRTHPALTPAGEGWYSIYRPRRDSRLSWPYFLAYDDGTEISTSKQNGFTVEIHLSVHWSKDINSKQELIPRRHVQAMTSELFTWMLCRYHTIRRSWVGW